MTKSRMSIRVQLKGSCLSKNWILDIKRKLLDQRNIKYRCSKSNFVYIYKGTGTGKAFPDAWINNPEFWTQILDILIQNFRSRNFFRATDYPNCRLYLCFLRRKLICCSTVNLHLVRKPEKDCFGLKKRCSRSVRLILYTVRVKEYRQWQIRIQDAKW